MIRILSHELSKDETNKSMFGSKKSITDRVKNSLTDYMDDKFENYRGQIALDLAKGLGSLAGLIAIWSIAIITAMFLSIAIALLLGWAFSFFIKSFAYVLSFLLVSIILMIVAAYVIKHKEQYIVQPVFEIMSKTLRGNFGLEEEVKEEKMKPKTQNLEHQINTTPSNEKTKAPKSTEDKPSDSDSADAQPETPIRPEED